MAINNNQSLKLVQQILGHSNFQTTTDIYGKLCDKNAYQVTYVLEEVSSRILCFKIESKIYI